MGHPYGANVLEVLGADRTMTQAEVDDNNVFSFDPTTTRNLDLPPEADNAGIVLFIYNAGATGEIITIRDDAGALTIATPDEDQSAIVFCDGVSWRGSVGAAV